ncbi:MAG TPA: adenylate/guanylate cyclase domain-containing protein [Actinomycetota bacterium]|nr:adenylate/guanylate cyclase domain-containing protein [Actinomycetota bacterium]
MRACPECGRTNPEGFQFCGSCGARLAPEGSEIRKTVTVLFADVTGSTSLGERLDSESLRGVMSRYFDAARSVLERHGGTVEKFIGDAVMAVFGVPEVHEDDALRAARAAVELRAALAELGDELERSWGARLQIRTGVNTGDVVAGDPAAGQSFVSGDPVNVAARLEQAAQPGEILLGAQTLALVRDAVRAEPVEPLSLKGKAEPVAAFRLLEVLPGAPAHVRRLDSPMLGRDGELAAVVDAFGRAEHEPGCELVTILGVAGVGKSRLIREVSSRLRDRARILEGRCLPYGDGITFWPLAEIVKRAAGIEDTDAPDEAVAKIGVVLSAEDTERASLIADRVSAAIGLGQAEGVIQETFWAFRRLLEILAADRPLVAVIDDIHWAEPTLMDLLEYVTGFSRGSPLLLLCTARPELREAHPEWGRSGTTVVLHPLGPSESEELIRNLIGYARLPAEVQARVVAAAEGNPLFVEEMLRMLIDDGLLRREDGQWVSTVDLSEVSTPGTIQALIAARLDRLEEDERAVIQRASVVGKVFYWGAVTELSPEEARGKVGGSLQTLARKELILPEPSPFAGDDAFRFSHILVHDTAYGSTPKRMRADLHERFATWLERAAGPRLAEFEEIVGHHLELSYRYLAELGPVDDRALTVAAGAAARLGAAGRRAFARGDTPAAANLLSRAADLLPERDPARLDLLPELGEVLSDSGAWQEAEAVLTEAIELARSLGDRRSEALAVVPLLYIQLHNGRFAANSEAVPPLERAISMFEDLGDDGGLADGWVLRGYIEFWSGRAERAVEAGVRAVDHARRAQDARREAAVLQTLSFWQVWGPTPVEELLSTLEDAMAGPAGTNPLSRAALVRLRAVVEVWRGSFGVASELAESAKSLAREYGARMDLASASATAGLVALLRGDASVSEREAAEAVAFYRAIGDVGHLSSYGPALADALYAQGRDDEALALTEEAERVSIEGDTDAQVHWRRVRAKVLARRGELDAAERLANEAAGMARLSDDLDKRGRALLDLAEVLRLAGRSTEAAAAAREALETFERKGNVVLTEAARRTLRELAAST